MTCEELTTGALILINIDTLKAPPRTLRPTLVAAYASRSRDCAPIAGQACEASGNLAARPEAGSV